MHTNPNGNSIAQNEIDDPSIPPALEEHRLVVLQGFLNDFEHERDGSGDVKIPDHHLEDVILRYIFHSEGTMFISRHGFKFNLSVDAGIQPLHPLVQVSFACEICPHHHKNIEDSSGS
eukprot:CAMPEP_0114444278 /NCGR_PEP_ID=MMETSP0103-20121206/17998_1 /TAXON_ID=37642 ORGANISM="Paraphysomonas imperforata, Strain PA2" /NCGR_SAMPLE_ID=MMETSP0103 /ASSEMBLY_ACC=CAM_ASM_000201 /LENGTH=117 /DNA_ID=CAMNT_0001615799 /DNA_START=472 /DNA_END=822 /DNA_ORIENTATION=-